VRFEVLGPLRVIVDHREAAVMVPAPRQRVLLAALLRRANQPVPVEELAELVWDGAPPKGAVATAQAYVMRLRRVLGERAGGRILTRAPGYVLELDEGELDAARFEVLGREAGAALRGEDWDTASARAGQALALWRGDPLADVASQMLRDLWLPQLEQLRVQVLEWSAEAGLHLGRHEQLIPRLRELAGFYPLRERFWAQLMLALARGGRQAEALQAYQDARTRLAAELGIEPGPELQDLHRRILTGDQDLLAGSTPGRAISGDVTAAGAPRQLPADTPAFTGRQAELTRLVELAGAADGGKGPGTVVISAIDGMAGIGKTALAVRVAHRLAGRFGDGQLFIDLHGYTQGYPPRTAGQALETLLRALGVPPRQIPGDAEERAALYRQRLAGTHTLIVLDNAAGEAQVRPLIPGVAGCLVLVTSRRKLKALDDAHTVPLDVLPEPEAIALLRTVAGPGRLAADDPAASEIACLCGYLPLAVRIAAALLRSRPAWSPDYLAGRLRAARSGLGAFSDGDRDLAAIFALSSQALGSNQGRLYRYLGLLPGPVIDAYAAAALLDADPAAAEHLLQDLADQNLLLEPAAGRYRMHDLIRAHARGLALSGPAAERETAISRLLDYYQHTAGRADARIARRARPGPAGPAPAHAPALPDADAARTWLRAERTNLSACLRYAIEHGQDDRIVALAAGLASLLRTDGPWAQAMAAHAAAAAAAGRLGDRPGQAHALTELGNLRRLTGDYPGAERGLRAALELHREAGDKSGQAGALTELGSTKRISGDYPGADRSLQEAVGLYQEAGDKSGQARALTELGSVRAGFGQYQDAQRRLQQALGLYRETGSKQGQARALIELAEIQGLTGDHRGALRNAEAALEVSGELGDRLGQANAETVLGRMWLLTGDYQGAARHQKAAMDLYRELGHRLGQANARTLLAEVRRLTGDYQGAARDFEEAISTYQGLGNRGNLAWTLNHYAAVISAAGDLTRATALYHDALNLARDVRQPDDEAAALQGLGETRLREGKPHDAAASLRQALEIYQRLGMPAAKQVAARLAEIGACLPLAAEGTMCRALHGADVLMRRRWPMPGPFRHPARNLNLTGVEYENMRRAVLDSPAPATDASRTLSGRRTGASGILAAQRHRQREVDTVSRDVPKASRGLTHCYAQCSRLSASYL
jgi:DNA-binding SARP family transcriptional activator/tetratricopeptide (TPR) repeat protein